MYQQSSISGLNEPTVAFWCDLAAFWLRFEHLAKCKTMGDGLSADVPSWCLSGLRFGPIAGSLFLLRFGRWSRRQAMACHGRVFNLRFDCVLNRFVYPSRSKLAFWSCVLNSVICVPEPCVSVLRSKDAKLYYTHTIVNLCISMNRAM